MNFKQLFKSLVFLALGIFLVFWSVKDLSSEEIETILSAIKSFPVGMLAAVGIIGLLPHYIRAVRWKMLLKQESKKTSNLDLFAAVMVGYIANLAFPRLGEVSRCGILNRKRNVDFTFSLGTVFFERILDVLCLFVVVMACLIVEYNAMYDFIQKYFILPYYQKFTAIPVYFYVAAAIVGIIAVAWLYKNKNKFLKSDHKIMKLILGFKDGLIEVKNVKNPALFVFYTLSIWVLYLLIIYISYFGFKEMENLHFGSSISLLVAGTVAMVLVQGGIGIYPVLLAQVLAFYGVKTEIAIAFGWVVWSIQTFLVVITGGLSFAYFAVANKK